MTTPQRPLKPLGVHTSPRTRNRVWAAFSAGKPAAQIASEEGLPRTLVYGIRTRFAHQDWGVSPQGRGRPSKLTKHDLRRLRARIEEEPSVSIRELQKCAPHVSADTIRRHVVNITKEARKAASAGSKEGNKNTDKGADVPCTDPYASCSAIFYSISALIFRELVLILW